MKTSSMNYLCLIFVCVAFVLIKVQVSSSSSVDRQLTLTLKQKALLDKFRDEVSNELPHKYMDSEVYLVMWLRAANFDVEEAKRRLRNNLVWRAENKMDDILSEDFSDFQREYPFWSDGVDHENRPVATAELSDWDPRPAIIAGKADKYLRYLLYNVEKASQIVREQWTAGKDVTQVVIIINVDGFSVTKHACMRCMSIYINFLLAVQNHYAGGVYRFFLINTPASYEAALRVAYPFLNQETKNFLRIYGVNKKEWQKAILEVVPADEIRPRFGGTKSTEFD